MVEIPGYTLTRELGRGGMGTVYLARQHSLDREVAIKVLSSDVVARDPSSKGRFLREARIAAQLHHPHVGAVHDVVELESGTAYIAMEFLPGGSVARGSAPPEGAVAALGVVREVASALDYAHANGVVHRDIKPENILRRRDGSCVLSDFGIARAIEPSEATNTLITGEGAVIGTPHYMSPEQLRAEKLDGRSDLYSLGVALYQMLTGELPYTGSDTWAIGIAHMTAPIPRLPPEHAALQPLVDALMAKNAADRPGSGAELVARIDALLDALAPRPPSLAQRLKEPLTPRQALAFGAIALLALGALLAWHPWKARRGAAVVAAVGGVESGLPRIAVLPLDALGVDAAHAYLADGLHEEMLTALSKLSGLQVISRTTMKRYASAGKTPQTIAAELHASHVLSGSVAVAGEQMRVNLELVDPQADTAVWGDKYDRPIVNALTLQSDIAQEVARALKARVLPAEKLALDERGTSDGVAEEEFLKARVTLEPAEAERLLDLALERDPSFVAALAERVHTDLVRYWSFEDLTPERLAKARRDVEALEKIAPASAHTEYAAAWYDYYGRLDYASAHARAQHLAEQFPGRSELQFLLAALERSLGRFDESTARYQRGLALDPLNVPERVEWISHLLGLRQYGPALAATEMLESLDPGNRQFRRLHAEVKFCQTADPAELEAVLAHDGAAMSAQERRDLAVAIDEIHGRVDKIIAELRTPRDPTPNLLREPVPQAARDQIAAWLSGDQAMAQVRLDEALAYYAAGPDRYPTRALPKVQSAMSYALAGARKDAVKLVDEALAAQTAASADAVEAAGILLPAATVLAIAGEADRAMDLLERSVALPFGAQPAQVVTTQFLQRALKGNARFDALCARLRAGLKAGA